MNNYSSSFFFGGQEFPIKTLNKHLFYLGATGSGKTVSILILLRRFLLEVGKHAHEGGYRALLYDPKTELRAQLWAIEDGIQCPVKYTNPFDHRSTAWRIADDITSPAAALEMAHILCPVNEAAAQPFFDRAVLSLLYGVLLALHLRAPGKWDLRTVCLVMRSEHHLRELLSQTNRTQHLPRLYLQEGKLTQSVMATVDTKLLAYNVIAALWSKSDASFSLREFRASESVLVLGNHEEARMSIDAINRVLIKRLTELLLEQSDSDTRRTLICLDELREAGLLDGLVSLALRGRSRGVSLVAGAQDFDGLAHMYGEEVAHELLGQFGYKAILKLESPNTAKYASSLFGATEVKEILRSDSKTLGGEVPHVNQGKSETLHTRDVLLPNELLNLPPASAKSGLTGAYKTPYGSFRATFNFMAHLPCCADKKPAPENYNFRERSEKDQYLEDWTGDELLRFGLTPIPSESTPNRERAPRPPRNINKGDHINRNRRDQENVDQDEDKS